MGLESLRSSIPAPDAELEGPLIVGMLVSSLGAELDIPPVAAGVVVATPGRVLPCLNRPTLLRTLVLRLSPPSAASLSDFLFLQQQKKKKKPATTAAAMAPTVKPATAPFDKPRWAAAWTSADWPEGGDAVAVTGEVMYRV